MTNHNSSCVHWLLPVLVLLITGVGLHGQEIPPSLYSDRKARVVGDMVTILVTEMANAKRESQSQRNDNNPVSASGAVDGNLLQFLPIWGLKSSLKTEAQMREGTTQKDQLTGRIAAVITDITDNGQFRVSGSKVININGERNLMTVKGIIRPRDIRSDNTVFSYNIANAKIYYSQAGLSGKLIKRGSLPRLANIVMGGAGLLIIGYVGGLSALAIIRSFRI